MRKFFMGLLIVAILTIAACKTEPVLVKLGTGSETGVYYQVGKGLADMSASPQSTILIQPVVSEGSVENINKVLQGEFGFGIAQSDRQYQAFYGFEDWQQAGQQTALRTICSLYPETVTLIASEESGIQTVYDLKNMRVNLGEKGSGQHQNALDVLSIIGYELDEIEPFFLNPQTAAEELHSGGIDAFFYTIGHPNELVKQTTRGLSKVRFIPIVGYDAEKLLMDYPYYSRAMIPIDRYPDALNEDDVESIGVRATLITSMDVSDEIVGAFTKNLFEQFDLFTALHPALSNLKKDEMFQALSAPIHPGAIEYFRDSGLLQFIEKDLITE